ncbi:MAG: tetratricopeptide repeat protein, partial [Anaerolineales bacterium]|nr:tetratricopeptide repeat protein [Anaerolineales bacterium]
MSEQNGKPISTDLSSALSSLTGASAPPANAANVTGANLRILQARLELARQEYRLERYEYAQESLIQLSRVIGEMRTDAVLPAADALGLQAAIASLGARIHWRQDQDEPMRARAEEATQLFQDYLVQPDANLSPQDHDDFGIALAFTDQFAEAVTHLEQALNADLDDRDARYCLALAYWRLEAYETAVVALEPVLLQTPTAPRPLRLMGEILRDDGQGERAAKFFQDAGLYLVDAGKWPEADEMFREALALNPASPPALIGRAE